MGRRGLSPLAPADRQAATYKWGWGVCSLGPSQSPWLSDPELSPGSSGALGAEGAPSGRAGPKESLGQVLPPGGPFHSLQKDSVHRTCSLWILPAMSQGGYSYSHLQVTKLRLREI